MSKVIILLFLVISFSLSGQPTSWTGSGIGGGGSLFSPTISPANSSVMYMQCDMSEVFQTGNAGDTWDKIPFTELISTGGQHKVEFTSDPMILYTVNLDFNNDFRFPVKSTDGGSTWQNLTSDPTSGEVWSINADPATTNRLLITSYTELFISTDGGTSFQSRYSNASGLLISGVFWDGVNIFIGTNIGMLVSTNGGSSFSLDAGTGIPAGQGFISFTGAKNGSVTRLMGTTADQGDLYPGINALDIGIYSTLIRRDYGSGNWVNATTGINAGHDLFCIASSRINTNVYYVGGNNPSTSYPVIYKTANGGTSWSEVFLTEMNQNISTGYSGDGGDEDWYYGEIVFGLAVGPNDPSTVIFTDFGFAHVTRDGGTTWKQAYVNNEDQNPMGSETPQDQPYRSNGLENTSCWNLHWNLQNPDNVFASYTDITGVRSLDGGTSWAFDYSGISYNTVYHVVEHPVSHTLYAAVSSVHDLYQSTYLTDGQINGGTGAILYSTNNGASWSMLHNFAHPVIWLALDPTNTNRMYASVVHSTLGGIARTDNLNAGPASTWVNTTAPPRTQGHPYNVYVLNDGAVVSTWSGRRTTNFTASSGVFLSTNQGGTWSDLSMSDEMHYWTKDITIDPTDNTQNTWYVGVFSGWGGAANDKGGLYKTTNRGQSWVQISNSYRVESATVNPLNANQLYFTTESEGLWYSNNATNANPIFTQLPAYDFMHPMRVIYNPFDLNEIWVTSFGNGLQRGTVVNIPLPLHLISFEGIKEKNHNLLKWSATDETGIRHFKIEKNTGNGKFLTIGQVGTSDQNTGVNYYEYIDTDISEAAYYRLLIVNNDGSSDYSEIVFINRNNADYLVSEVYPSPAPDLVNVDVFTDVANELNVEIFDMLGNKIFTSHYRLISGDQSIQIDTQQWIPGIYLMHLKDKNHSAIIKKIVKKD